jgi:hypothetical protein
VVYTNVLVYAIHDPLHPFIVREYPWRVDVECDMSRVESVQNHFNQHGNIGGEHHVTVASHFDIQMSFYNDSSFRFEKRGNPLYADVGENVFVKVYVDTDDWNIKLRLDSCYTKPTPGAADSLMYYIIQNG